MATTITFYPTVTPGTYQDTGLIVKGTLPPEVVANTGFSECWYLDYMSITANTDPNQLDQPFDIVRLDINNNERVKTITPIVDPYKRMNMVNNVSLENFKIDGVSYIETNILGDQTIILIIRATDEPSTTDLFHKALNDPGIDWETVIALNEFGINLNEPEEVWSKIKEEKRTPSEGYEPDEIERELLYEKIIPIIANGREPEELFREIGIEPEYIEEVISSKGLEPEEIQKKKELAFLLCKHHVDGVMKSIDKSLAMLKNNNGRFTDIDSQRDVIYVFRITLGEDLLEQNINNAFSKRGGILTEEEINSLYLFLNKAKAVLSSTEISGCSNVKTFTDLNNLIINNIKVSDKSYDDQLQNKEPEENRIFNKNNVVEPIIDTGMDKGQKGSVVNDNTVPNKDKGQSLNNDTTENRSKINPNLPITPPEQLLDNLRKQGKILKITQWNKLLIATALFTFVTYINVKNNKK